MGGRTILIILATLLLGGSGMVAYSQLRPPPPSRHGARFSQRFPTQQHLPGWTVREENSAETPEMRRAVDEILNYDSARLVSYIKGEHRVSLYIATWKPGRMSSRLVRGHTPDVCWVGGGWRIMEAGHNLPLPASSDPALRVEQRRMRFNGHDESVVYWHTVDGVQTRNLHRLPPWHAMITDLFERGWDQRAEQVFVRISGNIPPEQWPPAIALTVTRSIGE